MYEGPIADALVTFLAAGGSAMAAADFAAHAAERPTPLTATEGEVRWWAAPPPSQGATALALLGDEVDTTAVDLGSATPSAVDFSSAGVNAGRPRSGALARARAAQAARAAYLGDPRGGEIDVDAMLAPGAAPDALSPPRGTGDTVAITAVDDEGRSVALIQSVFQTFGAGLLEPRTGIVLHNRGSAFSLVPGHPAEIGRGGGRRTRSARWLRRRAARGPRRDRLPGRLGAGADPLPGRGRRGRSRRRARRGTGAAALGGRRSSSSATSRRPSSPSPVPRPHLPPRLAAPGVPPLVLGAAREDRCGHVQISRVTRAGKLEAAADPRADGSGVVTHTHKESS